MEADVGDGVPPLDGGGIDGGEGRDVQAAEEVLLHVTHAVFDAAFFVAFAHVAGDRFKAVVGGQIQVARMKSAFARRDGAARRP